MHRSSPLNDSDRQPSTMSTKHPSVSDAMPAGARVGWLKAQSPWLRKDGVCIAVFEENSTITFLGRVQLRVLAGVLNCFGYVLKPSTNWHDLFVPVNLKQPALSLSPLSLAMTDPEFSSHLEPFRCKQGVHFHALSLHKDGVSCSDPEGCAIIDLEGKDLSQMNHLARGQWRKMVAVVLFKPLTTPFYRILTSYAPSATHVYSLSIDGCQIVDSRLSIEIPPYFKNISWELAQINGVSLLVCGPVGVGKSTLCRYLINYLLNRWPVICFIDLDVGQTEFTVPGVVSLHLLTEPVLGPPMTHLRTPAKAYYFGENSPGGNPDLYFRAAKGLQRHLTKVVRHTHPDIPVIINTCGWVKDQGFSLLLDFIRTFKPSHIVQLLHNNSCPHDTFSELTPRVLQLFSGIYTRPESSWGAPLTLEYATTQEDDSARKMNAASQEEEGEQEEEEEQGEEGEIGEVVDNDQCRMDFAESLSDSGDEEGEESRELMAASSSSSSEEESDDRVGGASPLLVLGDHTHHQNEGPSSTWTSINSWIPLLSHRLFKALGRSQDGTRKTPRLLLRQLMLLSYFSPLLEVAESVARELNLSHDPIRNMMFFAPPLDIPWSDVAIHVVTSQVPRSQMLYALIGRTVALGQVHSKEIVSFDTDSPGVGVIKFLKSSNPLIEFVGLGLVRAIDPAQQQYYVTTPLSLSPELLDRVNVLAVGHTDSLPHLEHNTAATIKSPLS